MGRGACTMYAGDLAHADCIIVEGSNMAENHPVAFRWVMKAKLNGAKIIHVDPRFTRTSAVADIYAPIRAGTDIAFLGGLIRYVIENNKYFKDYVVNYTNAATIVSDDFKDTEDLDGVFSGLEPYTRRPDQRLPRPVQPAPRGSTRARRWASPGRAGAPPAHQSGPSSRCQIRPARRRPPAAAAQPRRPASAALSRPGMQGSRPC